MNPYFSSRLADDRLADRLAGRPGGRSCAGRTASGDGGPTLRHADPAAWVLRSAAAPRRRVRRRAGWLLVDAGLRLVVGRGAASLRG